MSSDQNPQGQYPPPQWESQPPRGAYPPPPPGGYGGPPTSQIYHQPTGTRPDMVTLPPPQQQHQDLYRHPAHDMYPGHAQDPYRGGPPQHMSFNQPAPRQRTAIACRYCRRRKIRCSGFEASEDGRCINCQRFQQECIFTPVSSQAQAFVPAHVAYPDMRNRGGMPSQQRGGRPLYPQQGQPVIYGAHGQPLGPMPHQGQDPNYPPQPPQGYPMPSPTQPYPGHVYDDRGPSQPPHPQDQVSRKRPRSDDSAHPVVPPPPQVSGTLSSHPYPQQQRLSASSGGRRGSGGGFEYPDPPQLAPVSPASSSTSYHSSAPYPPPPPQQQPYYPSPQQQNQSTPQPQSVRRSSPQSAYSYDARGSGSPHGSTSSAAGYSLPGGLHPPQVLPPRDSGHTPPPQGREGGNGNGSAASRAGMSVRDMLGPGDQGGRTTADSDMLNALNRRGM